MSRPIHPADPPVPCSHSAQGATPCPARSARPWLALLCRLARPLQPAQEEGQSLTELTLFLPVVALMVLVMVDFGRAVTAAIAVSNAARGVATIASQNYVSPLACLQSSAQQFVSLEVPGATAALTIITPASPSPAYNGEQDVQATVTYPFTPVTPLISGLAGGTMIRQSASDPLEPMLGAVPAVTPILTATTGTSAYGEYQDLLTWQLPVASLAGYTATFPTGQGGTEKVYTASVLIYSDTFPVQTTPPNGCPILDEELAADPVHFSSGVYTATSYSVPITGTSSPFRYWIQVLAPHPPGARGTVYPASPAAQQ